MDVEETVSTSHFLNAFAGLARQLGIETSEGELRRAYALTDNDVPFSQLAAVVSDNGFHIRKVELEWFDLPALKSAMSPAPTWRSPVRGWRRGGPLCAPPNPI